jgi:hypothetical protein
MFEHVSRHVEWQSFQLVDQSFQLLRGPSASQLQPVCELVQVLHVEVMRRLDRRVIYKLHSLDQPAVERTNDLAWL